MPQSQYNYIFQFCKKGKVKQLLDSLQAIEYKNLVDERGNTLLCTALKHAQWKVLNALLKLNLSFTPNKPPLITASQCSKDDSFGIETVFPLYPDINVQNHQQRTALMTACLLGHGKKVSTLLSLNAA
ncbi:MAG TPA: ankyrin repeat domain-containing protein, partial [Oceanospirillales bacterium]|nr:ankyrin repeat domain-containing protein [Oceanospirillales bacterium]